MIERDMTKKINVEQLEVVHFDTFAVGGQALGKLENGKKVFAYGVLPGESALVRIVKNKSTYVEAIAKEIVSVSTQRVTPLDNTSYLSTSPFQILNEDYEDQTKLGIALQCYAQEKVMLPLTTVRRTNSFYHYRNKVEFSWYWNNDTNQLDLAFFGRGTHSKIPVEGSSLLAPELNHAAIEIRNHLRECRVEGRQLKTLLLRSQRDGQVAAQLYVKDENFPSLKDLFHKVKLKGFSVIYSNPKSPASVVTTVLETCGDTILNDTILGVPFHYKTEGFFQVNLAIYEEVCQIMKKYVEKNKPIVDMYSGVGSIGLSITDKETKLTLVEQNPACVDEMKRNIRELNRMNASAVLSDSEKALDYITSECCLLVDPPRAGLHPDVVAQILKVTPSKILYLSCNPSTQARDVKALTETNVYKVVHSEVFNFFPRTPHIEQLIVLECS